MDRYRSVEPSLRVEGNLPLCKRPPKPHRRIEQDPRKRGASLSVCYRPRLSQVSRGQVGGAAEPMAKGKNLLTRYLILIMLFLNIALFNYAKPFICLTY